MELILCVSQEGETGAPARYRLGVGAQATIGRGDDNDIVLGDAGKHVSRRHARIAYRQREFVYTDVGANPSLVNGHPLGGGREHALCDGDCIAIGDFLLRVQLSVAPALSAGSRRPAHLDARPPDALAAAAILGNGEAVSAIGDDPLGLGQTASAALFPQGGFDAMEAARPEAQPMPHARPVAAAPLIPADYDPLAPAPGPAVAGQDLAVTAMLQALLRGLGLPQPPGKQSPVEFAEEVGAMLRVATVGTMDALRTRALAKRESRVAMTMIAAGANNPLKFLPDAGTALEHMLSGRRGAYMAPEQAFADAFGDLRAHELAMMAGVKAALDAMLASLAPQVLQARAVAGKRGLWLRGGRKRACWDEFIRLHERMSAGAGEEFQRLFSESFAPAYEQQMERIRERGAGMSGMGKDRARHGME